MFDQRLVVIVGPTGSGKSGLAIELAVRANSEVVSADSQQVFVGMDIGTGKVPEAERRGVLHHLIDILQPDEPMTAVQFGERADEAIAEIASRGKNVVVAGGTMLYIRALLFGLFDGPPASEQVREELLAEAEALGGAVHLWERLDRIDPDAAARIDPNDLRRIVRAIEVYELTGEPISEHQKRHDHKLVPPRYPAKVIGLEPERSVLYERIEARVEQMVADGLVDEVAGLRAAGYGPSLRSQGAIGYAEIHRHLDGELTLDEAVALVKRNSRRYARRQLSWYRRDPSVIWHAEPGEVDLGELQRYLTPPGG